MAHHDQVDSEKSSVKSGQTPDTKAFPLATVDEPVFFTAGGKNAEESSETDSLAKFYRPIESYEGYHRWDPQFQWDEKEEKRLIRKVSITIYFEVLCLVILTHT